MARGNDEGLPFLTSTTFPGSDYDHMHSSMSSEEVMHQGSLAYTIDWRYKQIFKKVVLMHSEGSDIFQGILLFAASPFNKYQSPPLNCW
ncbi:hypothetical protein C5167_015457 [Papaver somniferum]|uniref:Uncharacterized protein n=1 Tax=Papaver somniferum TaxID=3469 RepID=A0A4Y7J700_PAPSO|nr:hypothetical protein C5167_015457 [Papaver somniferum]